MTKYMIRKAPKKWDLKIIHIKKGDEDRARCNPNVTTKNYKLIEDFDPMMLCERCEEIHTKFYKPII